jgi:hypothetical protein
MNNAAIMADETPSTTMMMETTQSCVKVKEKYTNNDDCHNTNKNNSKHDGFFQNWKVGNWCWERDYNKYLVSSTNCHDDDCMNAKSNSNNEEMRTIDEACNDDGMDVNDNDDEEKPAAIISSSSSSCSSICVATTAAMEIVATNNRNVRQKISKSSSRCLQIKAEKNGNENGNDINSHSNGNDNDNDDSFYDDWVEGNWCFLDNYDNNNRNHGEGEGDDNKSTDEIRHEMTTRSRKKTRNEDDTDDNSKIRKSKRFRFHKDNDDNDNDEEEEEESYNEDEEYEENNDDDEEEQDSNDAQNRQEDNRPARKRSRPRPLQIQDDQIWMGMFERLVAYKKQHKNTVVPKRYDEHCQIVGCTKLGIWVNNQRTRYKSNKLLPNRVDLLNSINFIWDGKVETYDQMWMDMFEKLVQYKEQHKNTIVPSKYNNDPKLGNWVSEQRRHYKNDVLSPKRLALLNSVGFKLVGDNGGNVVDNEKWMNMFQKLVEYKKQHTNTRVPRRHNEDPKLGRWVSYQRQWYNEQNPKRLALLNSIDFK